MTTFSVTHSRTPTPLPPAPRRVRARDRKAALTVWGARLFVMPHMLIGIGATSYWIFLLLFTFVGTDSPARFLRTETSTSKNSTEYRVYFTYPTAHGERTASDTITEARFNELNAQTKKRPASESIEVPATTAFPNLTVHHLDLGPFSKATLDPPSELLPLGFLTIWLAIWDTVICAAFLELWLRPFQLRHLAAQGIPATATITRKEATQGKSVSYFLHYTFSDPSTLQLIHGKCLCPNKSLWDQAATNEQTTALVHSHSPKRNTLYEYGFYRCPE